MYLFKRWGVTEAPDQFKGRVFFVNAERSPGYSPKCIPPSALAFPTLVPKAKLLLYSQPLSGEARFSWLAPEEAFACQGCQLSDFFAPELGPEVDCAQLLAKGLNYTDLIKVSGNSFHFDSYGAFVTSSLMCSKVGNAIGAQLLEGGEDNAQDARQAA